MTASQIANDAATGAKVNGGSLHFTCNNPADATPRQPPLDSRFSCARRTSLRNECFGVLASRSRIALGSQSIGLFAGFTFGLE